MNCSYKKKDHPDIQFNNVTLADVEHHKHLGLTLSSNLSWAAHVNNILSSVSPMADVLKHLKYSLDRKTIETIYFSFVRPKLEYGSHIWDNCSKQDSEALEKFQLSIARIVTGARKGTSHELLYQETSWQTLAERRSTCKMKYLLKIINGDTPEYLQTLLPQKVGDIRPSSRNANNFKLVKARTETFRQSFIPSVVKQWNSLSEDKRLNACDGVKIEKKLYYYEGNRDVNIKHAQLRMQCSKLNAHLFALHVIDSPHCSCGNIREDCNHYLFHCPLFNVHRQEMFLSLRHIIPHQNIDVDILLFGSNTVDVNVNNSIMKAVHTFIVESDRL